MRAEFMYWLMTGIIYRAFQLLPVDHPHTYIWIRHIGALADDLLLRTSIDELNEQKQRLEAEQ